MGWGADKRSPKRPGSLSRGRESVYLVEPIQDDLELGQSGRSKRFDHHELGAIGSDVESTGESASFAVVVTLENQTWSSDRKLR